jgi:ComF family protein
VSACRSAYVFDGVVRTTIHRLKYHGEYARSEWCGLQVARMIIELGWRPDLIVPVPLHRSRLRSRGYNQSAKIASVASRMLDVPAGGVIVRTRATVSQVGLDADGRRANVDGAFSCEHDLSDLSVLLVDDVVTTGATIDACASACRTAGASHVWAATVATGS